MATSPSVKLFHGPGAWAEACSYADGLGRLVAEPYGLEGLKVDEAREVVDWLHSMPVGSELGVVLVGPLDDAQARASDALLKSLEEADGQGVVPVLWARDLGSVTSTVRSRCVPVWVAGEDTVALDEEVEACSRALMASFMEGDLWRLDLTPVKGKEAAVVVSLAEAILPHMDQVAVRAVWERLRLLARYTNPTPYELLSVFLGS